MDRDAPPLELVEGGQCRHCRAWQKVVLEPIAVDKKALDAITAALPVPVLVAIEIAGSPEERAQALQLERVARKLDGRGLVLTLDADEHREVAWELGVDSVPTILVFLRRAVIFTWEGYADASLAEEWLRMAYRM